MKYLVAGAVAAGSATTVTAVKINYSAGTVTASLPDVDDVLASSTTTLGKIKGHVQSLDSRIKDIAKSEQSKVEQTKTEYEKELSDAEAEVAALDKKNEELKKGNEALKDGNDELLKKANAILADNDNLREVMATLKGKIESGVAFVTKVEEQTDNKALKPVQLAVLGSKFTEQSDDVEETSKDSSKDEAEDDAEDDDDEDDKPVAKDMKHMIKFSQPAASKASVMGKLGAKPASFVQTGMKVQTKSQGKPMDWIRPTAADKNSVNIIQSLKTELDTLQQQENESLDNLQEAFDAKSKAIRKQKNKILKVQKKLTEEQESLTEYKQKLEASVSFLTAQKEDLSKSLSQLGNYMRQLAHVALAPPSESEQMLPTLQKEKQAEAKREKLKKSLGIRK